MIAFFGGDPGPTKQVSVRVLLQDVGAPKGTTGGLEVVGGPAGITQRKPGEGAVWTHIDGGIGQGSSFL